MQNRSKDGGSNKNKREEMGRPSMIYSQFPWTDWKMFIAIIQLKLYSFIK